MKSQVIRKTCDDKLAGGIKSSIAIGLGTALRERLVQRCLVAHLLDEFSVFKLWVASR